MLSDLTDQCAGDSRKLFRVVNSLSREPLVTALPEHDDPTKLANEFGTFFVKKIEIIKENLDKFQVQEPRLAPVTPKENLENFSFLSIEEVCKIVRLRILQCFLSAGSRSYMASKVLSRCISALYH